MAKNKQKKKKERERRIAQEKHAAAAQRRTEEKAAHESKKPLSRMAKVMTAPAIPKADYVATKPKMGFSKRRTGG